MQSALLDCLLEVVYMMPYFGRPSAFCQYNFCILRLSVTGKRQLASSKLSNVHQLRYHLEIHGRSCRCVKAINSYQAHMRKCQRMQMCTVLHKVRCTAYDDDDESLHQTYGR
eukprot:351801-Chlamydomonas_euryale.AAC.28